MYQILQRRSLRVIGDVRVAVSTVGYTLYRREGHPISPIGVLESRKKVRTHKVGFPCSHLAFSAAPSDFPPTSGTRV